MNKKYLKIIFALVLFALIFPVVIYGLPGIVMADESYIVLSSSMEPKLSPGDVIIVKKSGVDEIEVGDIITFEAGEKTVTHRVIEKITGKDTRLVTKGDAMEEADMKRISDDEIVGKMVLSFPFYGLLLLKANSLGGYILLILIPSFILIIAEVKKLVDLNKKERKLDENK